MLLSKKKRQEYLKALGFYKGNIDGIVGAKTKKAYLELQKKYFHHYVNKKNQWDGKYGTNTDKLLRNAYNVKMYCPNFKLEEFKCGCKGKHCTGYPAVLDIQLLKNVQATRNKFGPTTIPSGLRCSKHNSAVGGAALSRHKSGKAVDIKNVVSATVQGRKQIMAFWKTLPKWRYTYCDINGSNPNMGSSVHGDVK